MSDRRPKSIAEEIEDLARLTGAPLAFVEQVRALFTSKAISLDEAADPFLSALEEAFRREEMIRTSSAEARRSLTRMQEGLGRARDLYREPADQLRQAKTHLENSARRIRESGERLEAAAYALGVRRGVRRETDAAPIVPGPKDLQ
ncbi:MAG: hypothetical protein LAO51_01730 [Acidobacteriia bacterium]|nr:hypothetical protein [Terriglobia bacterium]